MELQLAFADEGVRQSAVAKMKGHTGKWRPLLQLSRLTFANLRDLAALLPQSVTRLVGKQCHTMGV